jgi:PIN domain nuclease of toxin-antitoxin system
MLIAQARHEAMCIVTYDAVFQHYPIDVLAVSRYLE